MQFFREERVRGVKHLAGYRYSTQGAPKPTYINLIALYCNIVGRNLFSKNPRIMLSTFDRAVQPSVSAMETWINQEIEDSPFAETMKRIVLDSLFTVGIGKVALATPADAATRGWNLGAGEPFFERIDLDDFVFDHHARDFSEVGYIGHRFRAPLDAVKNSRIYNAKAIARLEPSDHDQYNRQGDERVGMIGRGYYGFEDEYEDMIDLWEIYCPRYRCVYTFTEDDLSGPGSVWEGQEPVPLREQDWIGPDTGPYLINAYNTVPGNPFPKGPIQDLVELHEAANESYRKLVRQAARLKSNTVYQRDSDDGERARTANDGEMLGLNNPGAIQEVVQGGPNQGLFLFMKELTDRFSLMAGNLITMGGLAPQASTLGQEELLAQQSNGQVASMQDETAAFVAKVAKNMLWYWWYDPYKVIRTKLDNIPGVHVVQEIHPAGTPPMYDPRTGMTRQPMARNGSMPRLKIDPYSIRHATPQQRANDLIDVVTKIYVPLAQIAMQQGISLDFNEFLSEIGKLKDMPALGRILTIQEPPETESATGGRRAAGMPQETTRNYNRRSLGNGSAQAQDAMMETALESSAPMNGQLQSLSA
jgi:hypothetical protein